MPAPPGREETFRQVFEGMEICLSFYGVVDDGRDFVFRDINRATERRENIKREDVLGKRLTEIFPDIRNLGVLDVFRRVWETGEPGYHPLSFYKDGKISGWREGFVYKSGPDEILAVYKDETEYRKAEERARQLKRQMEFILGATKTGLDIRFVDPMWQNVYGNPQGKKCFDYFMGRSEPCPGCGIVKALETRQVIVTEEMLVKEGNRPIQVTTIPFQDEKGEWLVAEVNVDISQRKRAEELIENLARIPRENPDPVLRVTLEGTILYANPAAQLLLYVWRRKVGDPAPPEILRLLEEIGARPAPIVREIVFGERAFSFVISAPGKMHYVNLFGHDVTAQKRMKDRLQKLNDCLLKFGPNALENINSLVALCGELLEATCALYNRLGGGLLCSLGQWNTPPGFPSGDEPEGHICYDVIRRGGEEAFIIRNLPETPYGENDPNVAKYGLKTYIGRAVKCGGKSVGSLCAVYQEDHEFDEEDLEILNIIASAIQIEDERRRGEEELARLKSGGRAVTPP